MSDEPVLFGLKTCDTCRKALRAVPDLTLVDVRADGVPEDILVRAFDTFGDRLLNTRSTTWRCIPQAEKSAPALTLIKQHPALMKRPLILVDNKIFLGWNKAIESDVKALI